MAIARIFEIWEIAVVLAIDDVDHTDSNSIDADDSMVPAPELERIFAVVVAALDYDFVVLVPLRCPSCFGFQTRVLDRRIRSLGHQFPFAGCLLSLTSLGLHRFDSNSFGNWIRNSKRAPP